jgi:hypothetical protein
MKTSTFAFFPQVWRYTMLGLLAAVILSLAGATAQAQNRDPKAEELAHAVMKAMGGQENWDNAKFVRFDFKVIAADGAMRADRSHLWDKWTGRYRHESKTKEGKSQVVLFNVNDQKGSVYLDGQKLDDAAAAEPLKGAYGSFINDMYWLAMPWKWLDSGVNLKSMGPQEKDGNKYEMVELTFGKVGLTPGDMYHAYVSPDSHLMTYWEYTLQSGNKGAWNWEYGDHHGIKLASNHTNAEGVSINMGQVACPGQVDDAYFTDPAKLLAGLK